MPNIPWRSCVNSVALLANLFLFCLAVPAQRLGEFSGVNGFQGTVMLHGTAKGTQTGLLGSTTYDLSWQVNGQVKMSGKSIGGLWDGPITGTAVVQHTEVTKSGDCTRTSVIKSDGAITFSGGPPMMFMQVGPGDVYKVQLQAEAQGHVTITLVCPDGTNTQTGPLVPVKWVPDSIGDLRVSYPLPATGFTLSRSATEKLPYPFPFSSIATVDVTMDWELKGAGPTLEVIVEPQDYDNWRPEALFDEDTATSPITIQAKLQNDDGSALKSTDQATRFKFELINVSHEPGIAMNVPIVGPKSSADLQFVADENKKLIVTGAEHNIASNLPGSYTTASAVVSSFDWGAWGAVKVTAELPDGRIIEGYLKGDKNQKPIRLPKRAAESKIADGWKTKTGANKPDDDDSEKDPTGLQDCDGDGLTLYEEYRGFMENGAHIEGNPTRKDLFIRNEGGSTLEPGIWLYSDLTGLEVHKDIQNDEFDSGVRTINANHGEAPHRVDQHGVLIRICPGIDGGLTSVSKDGVHGRPGLVSAICIQPADSRGTLTKQFNLAASDAVFSYDIGVAHELLHASGVDHHGDGDQRHGFLLVPADDPANQSGKAYYEVDGAVGLVLDEQTGEDVAARLGPSVTAGKDAIVRAVDEMIAKGYITADAPSRLGTIFTLQELRYGKQYRLVGNPGGEHSGSDSCVMRYFFAEFYPARGQPNTYYLVPPGTEPSGTGICEQADGTGVNAPARSPQSRYSDATNSRGACRSWVCINDAIPPGVY